MRLTQKQRAFLDSIYDKHRHDQTEYWECFDYEKQTAKSLEKRGLIEFFVEEGRTQPTPSV